MWILRNITEETVNEQLELAVAQGTVVCDCEDCRADIMTYVLNRVPPSYVNSQTGVALKKSRAAEQQHTVDVLRFLTEAIQMVGAKPGHGSAPSVSTGDALDGYLIVCNADYTVKFASRSASYLLGFSQEYVEGRKMGDFIDEKSRGDVMAKLRAVVSDGETRRVTVEICRRGVRRYLVQMTCVPVEHRVGTPPQVILVIRGYREIVPYKKRPDEAVIPPQYEKAGLPDQHPPDQAVNPADSADAAVERKGAGLPADGLSAEEIAALEPAKDPKLKEIISSIDTMESNRARGGRNQALGDRLVNKVKEL
ncbi:MAG: late competence development ComFB family protein [Solirubrobacterales bacterium]